MVGRVTKRAVFAFGRMNPPTVGHEKLIAKVFAEARNFRADPFIFVSHSQDSKKNPLTATQKIKYIKMGISGVGNALINDPRAITPHLALERLSKMGYTDVIMIVGDDRVDAMRKFIAPYVNHPDPSKSFNLNSFSVVSAGRRDSSSFVASASASKMRDAAADGDFESFSTMCMSGLSDRLRKDLYNDVRSGMRINESLTEMKEDLFYVGGLYDRSEMPQLNYNQTKDFINYLKDNQVFVAEQYIYAKDIRFTQTHIDFDKIKEIIEAEGEDNEKTITELSPVILSQDRFLLDGHHRIYSQMLINKLALIYCYTVGLPINMLIKKAKEFLTLKEDSLDYKLAKPKKTDPNKTLNKPDTNTDRLKDKQDSEKDALRDKQAREKQLAREKDFKEKQKEKEQEYKKKETERKQKEQSEDCGACEDDYDTMLDEYLEDGTDAALQNRLENVPNQKLEKVKY